MSSKKLKSQSHLNCSSVNLIELHSVVAASGNEAIRCGYLVFFTLIMVNLRLKYVKAELAG